MSGQQVQNYLDAEARMLARFGIDAASRFIDVAAVDGRAHVTVTGEGDPVIMVIGGGPPPAIWAPLIAQFAGFTIHVVDLPGLGLTDRAKYTPDRHRVLAVDFLQQLLDGLGLDRPSFVSQSIGGLWTTWLALDRPERVRAIAYVGCPAGMLGSSAPLPLRLASIPMIGRLGLRLDPPSPRQVKRFAKIAGEDFSHLPELQELFVAFERLPGNGHALLELVHATVRLRGPQPQVELTASQLTGLRQPVTMIWGDHDTFGPSTLGTPRLKSFRTPASTSYPVDTPRGSMTRPESPAWSSRSSSSTLRHHAREEGA